MAEAFQSADEVGDRRVPPAALAEEGDDDGDVERAVVRAAHELGCGLAQQLGDRARLEVLVVDPLAVT